MRIPGSVYCQSCLSGRCCLLTGSICAYPYICKGYWECLFDQRKLIEIILLEGEGNYEKIEAGRIDWRHKLFPDEHKINKACITDYLIKKGEK